jgi:hypothetical protein
MPPCQKEKKLMAEKEATAIIKINLRDKIAEVWSEE